MQNENALSVNQPIAPHPRRVGWLFSAAVAVGGSNLSLFMLATLINGQNTAGIPLLAVGILISLMALPGWIELALAFPNKIGGIAACSAATLRRHNPILANIIGVSYWSCTVPGISFAAQTCATAVQQWLWPQMPVTVVATGLIVFFMLINLVGIHHVAKIVVPVGIVAVFLALMSAVIPLATGSFHWEQAFHYQLTLPFEGEFGQITAIMAGLYLIAFAAPAFEQGAGYVGETKRPEKNIPRAMYASGFISILYFIALPIIWLGTVGSEALAKDALAQELVPTFMPLLGGMGKTAAVLFMVANTLLCLVSAMSISSRTIAQISEDGLLPISLGLRLKKTDAPWVAVVVTAAVAVAIVWFGAPGWIMAATNFEYIIVVSVASLAAWLLRRENAPSLYRAPRGGIVMGVVGAALWTVITVLGFQQFGLIAVLAGVVFPFSGVPFYLWRITMDKRKQGLPLIKSSLHVKLTLTMFFVLGFDAVGYFIAVNSLAEHQTALITALEDIFVVVALLTMSVGLVLPGIVAEAAVAVSEAARRLVSGTLSDFSRAMLALGRGDLDAAYARIDIAPVEVRTRDELGSMAESFNALQNEIARSAVGLEGAREGLKDARQALQEINMTLEQRVIERTGQLHCANEELKVTLENLRNTQTHLIESEKLAALGGLVAGVAHEVNTPVGVGILATSQLKQTLEQLEQAFQRGALKRSDLEAFFKTTAEAIALVEANLDRASELIKSFKQVAADHTSEVRRYFALKEYLQKILHSLKPALGKSKLTVVIECPDDLTVYSYPGVIFQVITILVLNSLEHGYQPGEVGTITIAVALQNDTVVLRYSDTGVGIPKENLKRIFEPFFTTRGNTGGVGLGLHIAYNTIVKNLRGKVECHREEGYGAVFVITFPQGKVGSPTEVSAEKV